MAASETFSAHLCLDFPVNVQALPPKGLTAELKAAARECAALAKAHGLLAVHSFSAAFWLRPWKKRGVRIEGQIDAAIEQLCVISAEPLQNAVHERFEACFIPQDSPLAKHSHGGESELLLTLEGADAPEIFYGGIINLGAVAEEFFELALDPYPRREGISLRDVQNGAWPKSAAGGDAAASEPRSPFAVLRGRQKS